MLEGVVENEHVDLVGRHQCGGKLARPAHSDRHVAQQMRHQPRLVTRPRSVYLRAAAGTVAHE